jgi:signal transduction histidine kinase
MEKIGLSKILMLLTIILIASFQFYWLSKLYHDEWNGLRKETDVLLRNSIQQLQNKNLKFDGNAFDKHFHNKFMEANMAEGRTPPPPFFNKKMEDGFNKNHEPEEHKIFVNDHIPGLIDSFRKNKKNTSVRILIGSDSVKNLDKINPGTIQSIQLKKSTKDTGIYLAEKKDFFTASISGDDKNVAEQLKSLVIQVRTLSDSIPLRKVDSTFLKNLSENKIFIPYHLKMYQQSDVVKGADSNKLTTGYAEIGFNSPYAYKAQFLSPFSYIIQKIALPITVSFLIIIITAITFFYLYKNILQQQKLAIIKNEFISNISHELKTPIATVSVAIEALKNFGGIQSPEKTREYLDISSSELQRLSLLVDKVLKLSMFENKVLELKKEKFDLRELIEEVLFTMKLQFDKNNATVNLETDGNNFIVGADKLHITSVIYNLIDNALKYSKSNPEITIALKAKNKHVELSVTDTGIGIAKEYQNKIFTKFFRVPVGDLHNTKGYGLGLSYVSQVLKRHQGFIEVKSKLNEGSTFIVFLPYEDEDVIQFDENRKIIKRAIKL